MRVFMLGWEFPPFISGGLGTACYGLTKGLNELGHEIIFVLPQAVASKEFTTHVSIRSPTEQQAAAAAASYTSFRMREFDRVSFHAIPSTIQPYTTPGIGGVDRVVSKGQTVEANTVPGASMSNQELVQTVNEQTVLQGGPGASGHYGGDMFGEILRYARVALEIARNERFDVVHAHDWMTVPAGVAVSSVSGKPLVLHIHSTEFDRSGEHVNQRIYDWERRGVHAASKVIAVSHFTRNILLARYAASADVVEVVHNAIDNHEGVYQPPAPIGRNEKIVLFLGRITMQKGPEYFLAAAKKVLEFEEDVRFVMAGSGDMTRRMIELAAELGIGHKVLFTGFLRGADVARIYKMADLYVMPSVSEPFGIAPLEALSHDVPVLISKQSGVSEVLTHALKVDFWDINEMANKIIAVLRHPPLQATLREHGTLEVKGMTWKESAEKCVDVYRRALEHAGLQYVA